MKNVLLSLFALIFSGLVVAQPLHKFIVFGDSLCDNGNLYEQMEHKVPLSPPYHAGRFTNGLVWIEQLAESYFPAAGAAHLLDYAFGGAAVLDEESDVLFTLNREIQIYLDTHRGKADADSMFVVWIGANNYLGVPDDIETTLKEVNRGIQEGLQHLAIAGAKHILVVNLPDLGRIPMAREFNVQESMTYLSEQHNRRLVEVIEQLKRSYRDVQWLYFDVNATLNEVMDTPDAYGFTNITDTCYNALYDHSAPYSVVQMAAKAKLKNPCTGYLFFDPVHPTFSAHRIMAERAKTFLDNAGVEFAN